MWGKPCPPEAFAGLADLHLSHPDFVSRYETIARGLFGLARGGDEGLGQAAALTLGPTQPSDGVARC